MGNDGDARWSEVVPDLREPYVYQDGLYAIAQSIVPWWPVNIFRIELHEDGALKHLAIREHHCYTPGSKGSLATCVHHGQVFLFFDDQERGNNQYEVRYRTLSNPDVAWEPPELKELSPRGFATGIVGSYAPAGLGYSPPCIAAEVLNDRIYVFYHDEEFIYYRAYDGAEWTPRRKVSEDRYHPSFALCSATRNGEPVIVFAGVPHADSPHLHVKIVSGSGEVTGHGSIYLDWVQNNNRFGIGHGALLGEARSNVIQVFGNNSGSRTDLRRTTYDLDDLTSAGPWHDTGLSARPHRWSHCDVVRVVVPSEASSADPREYLVVLHTRDAFDTAVLVAPHGGMAAYPSPRP